MKTTKLTHSLPIKIIAFFLMVITACAAAFCAVGAIVLLDGEFYTRSLHEIKENAFYGISRSAGYTILYRVLGDDVQSALSYCEQNDLSAVVSEQDGRELWRHSGGEQAVWKYSFIYELSDGVPGAANQSYIAQIHFDDSFSSQNQFSFFNGLVDIGFSLRYWIYAIGAASLILSVACFIFLLCAAGHRAGKEDITASGFAKIPFDLLTGMLLVAVFLVASLVRNTWYSDIYNAVALIVGFVAAVIVGTFYCMNFAVRVKLGRWWENTIVYRLFRLIVRILGAIGQGLVSLVRNLPLIWKTALALVGVSILQFFCIILFYWRPFVLLLGNIVVIPAVLYLALMLRRLQKGGEALAAGDLSYQVDSSRMLWDLKRHADNLNSIGVGMTRAVDDRLKSERFKTELITNVSHDIKTPLTSIINYADLIGKEQTDNKNVADYAAVLLRQSERLKKLMEDLVEASKASTGNIDVLLSPCEVGVLLTQTAGEYEQRLRENQLELITRQPDAPIRIMADGRHLWRVFDNLMGNVCKYAQSGTRVYLSVEEKNGEALISFKNTSKYPLDMSTEELMERFVRGDSARNTDGNGLGLSIAQSLTELQNGRLELTVDGDLFKVVLRFGIIR